MNDRKKRVREIVDLINNNCISNQDQLLAMLLERGIRVTQATLSRDLKMLRTVKVPTDRGTYIYTLQDSNSLKDRLLANGAIREAPNFPSGFISLEFSGNIAVIKTRNGYANGLAYDIDMCGFPEILGTIPGSDTIFAVLREGVSHEKAREILARILPVDSDYDY
ncbi:MAG: arginine repressor [Clostridium sp.]|nr:hypothetical protein [Prevotella sp.]MCM1429256.1 arginine repressor [Clostridium sp.]MCM1475711.1 hypothetical protein [Muribaculaceae bacterium]